MNFRETQTFSQQRLLKKTSSCFKTLGGITVLAASLKRRLTGLPCFPASQILTKDSVTISVDGVVYYRVQNATLAVANITNADSATRLLAQTTLRNVLGTKNLSQILSDREEIAHNMQVRGRRRCGSAAGLGGAAQGPWASESVSLSQPGDSLAFFPSQKTLPRLDGRGSFSYEEVIGQ